jgi:hypothetical protein
LKEIAGRYEEKIEEEAMTTTRTKTASPAELATKIFDSSSKFFNSWD